MHASRKPGPKIRPAFRASNEARLTKWYMVLGPFSGQQKIGPAVRTDPVRQACQRSGCRPFSSNPVTLPSASFSGTPCPLSVCERPNLVMIILVSAERAYPLFLYYAGIPCVH